MPVSSDVIETRLRAAWPEAIIRLKDTAGDQDHYELFIATPAFEGRTRVQQHQMVYAALGDMVGTTLHALKLTTATGETHG